jgi:hypothetical protein
VPRRSRRRSLDRDPRYRRPRVLRECGAEVGGELGIDEGELRADSPCGAFSRFHDRLSAA